MTQSSSFSLFKRSACEGLATAMLVAAVVGSGILGERLSGGNTAIALLANTIATGAALAALILAFGQFSGAHLNPAVSVALALRGLMPWGEVPFYVAAQFAGGLVGTIAAHLMFGRGWYSISVRQRSGLPQLLSEFVATFGLLCVVWGCVRVAIGCSPSRRSRELYSGGVLVYGVDFVRQSCGHFGSFDYRQFFGHSSRGRARVYCRAVGWGFERHLALQMAGWGGGRRLRE